MIASKHTLAVPPGETIKEQLDDRNMTQKEFARRMELSEKHISHLINGEVKLTPSVALRLEMVLGIPASFWNNLESIYREDLEKVKLENEMEDDLKLLNLFPYNEMSKYGWVEPARKKSDKVFNLRKYFEVTSLTSFVKEPTLGIVCRQLGESEKSDIYLMSWAQQAKRMARDIEVGPIDLDRLAKILPEIRAMTKEDPTEFCEELSYKLAECGIALVFLPHIGGSYLHGASFLLDKKIVIGMTVRGKDADKFWFSLFHELGHILLGHLSQSMDNAEDEEAVADAFARRTLISDEKFYSFAMEENFNQESILHFAEDVDIDPGIVVGRLQKEELIPYNYFNNLKTRYKIEENNV